MQAGRQGWGGEGLWAEAASLCHCSSAVDLLPAAAGACQRHKCDLLPCLPATNATLLLAHLELRQVLPIVDQRPRNQIHAGVHGHGAERQFHTQREVAAGQALPVQQHGLGQGHGAAGGRLLRRLRWWGGGGRGERGERGGGWAHGWRGGVACPWRGGGMWLEQRDRSALVGGCQAASSECRGSPCGAGRGAAWRTEGSPRGVVGAFRWRSVSSKCMTLALASAHACLHVSPNDALSWREIRPSTCRDSTRAGMSRTW